MIPAHYLIPGILIIAVSLSTTLYAISRAVPEIEDPTDFRPTAIGPLSGVYFVVEVRVVTSS